jgi:hypothetical protein
LLIVKQFARIAGAFRVLSDEVGLRLLTAMRNRIAGSCLACGAGSQEILGRLKPGE